MLPSEVFASFHTLQRPSYESLHVALSTLVSLVVHAGLFIVVYSVSIGLAIWEEAPAEAGGGGSGIPPEEVVMIQGPLIMPPPEVIAKLLGEPPPREPERAKYLAERSSIARSESNPDPGGNPDLPKGGGDGPKSSESATSDSSGKNSPTESARKENEKESEGAKEQESERAKERQPLQLPGLPTPQPPRSSGSSSSGSGERTEIARAGSTPRELPTTTDNQESAVTTRGPISVNARGVGAVEAYRAYLERAIQQRWQIPPEANLLEKQVALTIEFEIGRDGRLLSIRPLDTTGVGVLDRAALRAIQLAAPFRPLPSIFETPSQIFLDTFEYNPPKGN
jgi:outer membrane biosynthesis protein TonB